MPQDSQGNYSMNPQISRMRDAAAQPAQPAAPETAAKTVTITEVPGQGFQVTGPDGQAQPAASLDEVMAGIQTLFGAPAEAEIAPDPNIEGEEMPVA